MIEELVTELSSAMRYNPDLSMTEVIKEALRLKYPTRNFYADPMKYSPTNSDILTALKTYNNMRQKDSIRYLEKCL